MNHSISHQEFMKLHAELDQLRAENKQLREWNKGFAEALKKMRATYPSGGSHMRLEGFHLSEPAITEFRRLEAEIDQLRAENKRLREANERLFEALNNITDRLVELDFRPNHLPPEAMV